MRSRSLGVVAMFVALEATFSACAGEFVPTSPTPPVVSTPLPPIADMSSLSAEEKEYATKIVKWYEGATKWVPNAPIPVWADPSFKRMDVQVVLDFWEEQFVPRKLSFRIVETEAEAKMFLRIRLWEGLAANVCANGRPLVITRYVITEGEGNFALGLKPGCEHGPNDRLHLTHELGHALGLVVHSPDGLDIMGSPGQGRLYLAPLTRNVLNWLYSDATLPGARVQS